jgi:hypothetical protein
MTMDGKDGVKKLFINKYLLELIVIYFIINNFWCKKKHT